MNLCFCSLKMKIVESQQVNNAKNPWKLGKRVRRPRSRLITQLPKQQNWQQQSNTNRIVKNMEVPGTFIQRGQLHQSDRCQGSESDEQTVTRSSSAKPMARMNQSCWKNKRKKEKPHQKETHPQKTITQTSESKSSGWRNSNNTDTNEHTRSLTPLLKFLQKNVCACFD